MHLAISWLSNRSAVLHSMCMMQDLHGSIQSLCVTCLTTRYNYRVHCLTWLKRATVSTSLSSRVALWCIHCQTWVRPISAVAASSIRLCKGTQPKPPSQASRYCTPTLILFLRHASVRGPLGTCIKQQPVKPDLCYSYIFMPNSKGTKVKPSSQASEYGTSALIWLVFTCPCAKPLRFCIDQQSVRSSPCCFFPTMCKGTSQASNYLASMFVSFLLQAFVHSSEVITLMHNQGPKEAAAL